ncbi:DUF202 domain-containing protein [Tsukamurella sp. 8F]|uniref:YidH family protein n=1 Tax=unclassified Tsukamurella TaxID=2633480 RepID=UPI0023B8880E|nr:MULTISPECIES: DUF202 domain-containing protein [unclassified Tsukamurella]MDF0530399.1 DUF202 domain-containing protein [Tsukamurella sp. 8J]MDF0587780.1 DUF202 domain-containing protein [Tsukamurella sp. 8F]
MSDEAEGRESRTHVDYRYSLANERTFLSWIRTSLTLLAGGVAVHTLVGSLHLGGLRRAIAVTCVILAAAVAGGAYRHWSRTEAAMEADRPLPRTPLMRVLTVGVAVVSVFAAIAVIFR